MSRIYVFLCVTAFMVILMMIGTFLVDKLQFQANFRVYRDDKIILCNHLEEKYDIVIDCRVYHSNETFTLLELQKGDFVYKYNELVWPK